MDRLNRKGRGKSSSRGLPEKKEEIRGRTSRKRKKRREEEDRVTRKRSWKEENDSYQNSKKNEEDKLIRKERGKRRTDLPEEKEETRKGQAHQDALFTQTLTEFKRTIRSNFNPRTLTMACRI